MIKILLMLSILFIGLEVQADPVVELEKYIEWRFRDLRPSVRSSRAALIPFVVKYSKKQGLDVLLVAEVMFAESSWRAKVRDGEKGERGLMQCHGVAARGFNLETVEGSLDCGTTYLRGSIDKCPTLLGALRRYQSGDCSGPVDGPRRRLKAYHEAISFVRGEK